MAEKKNLKWRIHWVTVGWILIGQLAMYFVLHYTDSTRSVMYNLIVVKNFFPTIDHTVGKYVFNAAHASLYLHSLGIMFPLLAVAMFFCDKSEFKGAGANSESHKRWPAIIVSIALALYISHFDWNDGFYVRLLAPWPWSFALAGSINFIVVAYLIRFVSVEIKRPAGEKE